MPFFRNGKLIQWTVRRRIIAGYTAMLGVISLGSMVAWGIGTYYRQAAFEDYQVAIAKREFLRDLQLAIAAVRPGKQLLPLLEDAQAFREESELFLKRIAVVQTLVEERRQPYIISSEEGTSPEEVFDAVALEALLSQYQRTADDFFQDAEVTFGDVQKLIDTGADPEQAREPITTLIQSNLFRSYIDFPDILTNWIDRAVIREQQAEGQLLGADLVRKNITLSGVFLSLAIALLISWWVSKTIAHPIGDVIHSAREITANSDFKRRMPVNRGDEIGDLTRTLNILFQQVDLLLSQVNTQNTELREALRKLQNHKVIDDRMASLSQVVAGVAHEINNPMTFIQSNIPYLERYFDDLISLLASCESSCSTTDADSNPVMNDSDLLFLKEDMPRIFESLKKGSNRINQIVMSLRTFARMDEADFKRVDIHKGIESTLMVLKHRLGGGGQLYGVKLIKNYGDIPEIECYAGQMNQVFLNILVNALDALAEARETKEHLNSPGELGKLALKQVDRVVIETRYDPDIQEVEIAIGNSAAPINTDLQQKIFDPFFTTKPVGQGMGMGLAICHQIIAENHGGTLRCVSPAEDLGVKFVMRLPIRRADVPAPVGAQEEGEREEVVV